MRCAMRRGLATSRATGSNVWYLNFNVAEGALRDKRVRQAVALAIDRPAIVASLWRGPRAAGGVAAAGGALGGGDA
jgi:ABC-type transport system substrate-binding protein